MSMLRLSKLCLIIPNAMKTLFERLFLYLMSIFNVNFFKRILKHTIVKVNLALLHLLQLVFPSKKVFLTAPLIFLCPQAFGPPSIVAVCVHGQFSAHPNSDGINSPLNWWQVYMALLSLCIMGWSELVALSACVVLAVTCLSGQPFVLTDIRPDATQNTGTVTAWAPFQALFPRKYMKLPANTKPVLSSALREYPEH